MEKVVGVVDVGSKEEPTRSRVDVVLMTRVCHRCAVALTSSRHHPCFPTVTRLGHRGFAARSTLG
jgi:hypothetical protein